MIRPHGRLGTLVVSLAAIGGAISGCSSEAPLAVEAEEVTSLPASVRLATFNIRELSTEALVEVDENGIGTHEGVQAAARVIAEIRPDILVVQEIDHDYSDGAAGDLALNAVRLRDSYLRHALGDDHFPYAFAAPCNTGIPSGHDLDNDGEANGTAGDRGYGEDCFGFGQYPGQYSMAVLSRFPIDAAGARTFQRFLWRDLPGNHLPPDFYAEGAVSDLRLSSKSHWDLPIEIGDRVLHLWISHPTPPVFDGEEDRNGRRNFDEIAFWTAYLDGEPALYDDQERSGGYFAERSFVIAGDLNADPRGDSAFYEGRQSIDLLLSDPRVQDTGDLLASEGAAESLGDEPLADRATAGFAGGMRVDYLLPSAEIEVTGGGVFWPAEASDPEGSRLAATASDHRLVWVDLDPGSFK
jgi:endonuclease/exonuclease/phosphatase family metal-dependent hydrolase